MSKNPYNDKDMYPTAREAQEAFQNDLRAAIDHHGWKTVSDAMKNPVHRAFDRGWDRFMSVFGL